MTKLLINFPNDEQRIVEVKEGGGYSDPSKVIWDERNDGPLPTITLGGMVRSGDILIFDQTRKDQHDAVINAEQAEKTRIDDIDNDIREDTVINQLKAMSTAEYNAWWSTNVVSVMDAIGILKRLVRLVLRRL